MKKILLILATLLLLSFSPATADNAKDHVHVANKTSSECMFALGPFGKDMTCKETIEPGEDAPCKIAPGDWLLVWQCEGDVGRYIVFAITQEDIDDAFEAGNNYIIIREEPSNVRNISF